MVRSAGDRHRRGPWGHDCRGGCMAWFSAHAILWVRFQDGDQGHYPVWETVFLVEAPGFAAAGLRAEELARREEGDCGGSLRWEGRPAAFVFGGVRKVAAVSHVRPGGELGDGDELAFSEYRLADEDALKRLAAGESAAVEYVE